MKPLNLALIFCSAMTLTACNLDVNLTDATENEGTDKVSVGDQDQINGGDDQDQADGSNDHDQNGDPTTVDPESTTVQVLWSQPNTRMNGDTMALSELAGYELRYRKADEEEYEVIKVGNSYSQYTISDLEAGDYIFKLAAYDVDGLYSDFVTATANN